MLYYLYNQFYHNKVMMYDEGTGLVKLVTPSHDAAQQWAIEEDGMKVARIHTKYGILKRTST
jgi:hypothetical protein